MQKLIYCAVCLSLLVPGLLLADGISSSEQAKEILRQLRAPRSFYAEDVQKGMKTKVYQRLNPDGTEDTRLETEPLQQNTNTPIKVVQIVNREGRWLIRQDIAARMDMLTESSEGSKPVIDDDFGYTLSEALFNGVQCFVIVVTIPTKTLEAAIKVIENRSSRLPNVNVADLIPAKRKYYIGKTNYFTYSLQNISRTGDIISEQNYSNVQLNIALSDDLFTIPKDLTRAVVKNLNDFKTLPPGPQIASPDKLANFKNASWVKTIAVSFFVLSSVFLIIYLGLKKKT
jgi:hypothetical protein